MKPLHHKTHPLAKRGLSLLCVLALCLGLLPVTALAAAPDGQVIYVGNENVTSGGYWTTDSDGNVTAYTDDGTTPSDNYIHYDNEANTLTLYNATIKKGLVYNEGITGGTSINDAAIGVFNQSGAAELTIILYGSNTIAEVGKGIYVLAISQSTGSSSLTIMGNGSLDTSSSQTGIWVQSNSNDAALSIKNAKVTATIVDSYGSDGVRVQSEGNFSASLTVDGGSLTATGSGATFAGIQLLFGSGGSVSGTPTVTVSGNAVVDAKNGGIANNSSSPIQYKTGSESTGGIVFDGNTGTVYGAVTLQEDITIGGGESLTIGKDASLTVPSGTTLTNNGTVTTTDGGSLTNQGTINNSGTLPDTISGNQPPKITTASLSDGTAGTAYNQRLLASGDATITWSSSDLPNWLTLNSDGTISGTPTAAGASTFTVTATNDSGSDSKAFILTVTQPVTSVTLDKNTLELYTGGSENLTATVAPDNATNKTVTWSSSDNTVATVDNNGNVTAVKAGTATITATAADGSGCSATCTVTVTDKTYTISADATVLNFGSAYTGYAQPAAKTVTLTNTGNQQVTVTLPTANDFIITAGTGFTDGSAAIKPGETATFTVQPKAGLSVGTYSDTITVSGSENVIVTIPASFTVKSRPSYNPPTVSEETTDAIQAADPGETVTVDLSGGDTTLDKEVFETLAGKDVTLVVELGDGVSWTVKGSDIPEDADFTDIDMGVTMNSDGIPVDIINAITGERGSIQLELAHNGAFGFTMTLTAPLGSDNAGYWANLYHFDEDTNKMTFETAAQIGDDGSVSLAFSHASQYAIVIDDHNHGVVTLPFTDVREGDWFYDPVCFVYSQGLMTGTSATTFEPNTHLSRAMLVAVLHRLEGSPQASADDFTDVAEGDWYAQAVNWAASVGVVNGFDDGTFQPNTAITREQMAAILRNYAAYKGLDVSASGSLSTITDAASVSDWAKESVEWAVGSGLIGGYEDSTLRPQGTTTRAEVASVLQRALGNVAGNQ